ncbi:TonB-dependent receptor [Pseudomonas sp. RIT-PI-AD]|uniref:TonB-dependent siderophore receptor n=1 Tax=Pseudomonas sp. RIT-PI-AD TaxID=3035294 RepID=UPI0021D97208|nr:TonB-dependent receptor [Pseudomonas sp. RIT-PI-AD]
MQSADRQGHRKKASMHKGAGIVCLSVSAALLSWGNAALAKPVKIDIPKQPLDSALREFGQQTGLQVLYSADLIRNAQSSRVSGNLESDTALQLLLDGTGYGFHIENGTVILEARTASTEGITLQPTAITSQGMGEVTENSGAYTTGAVSVGSKTPTSLRYTPQAVSVMTSQLMEDKGVTELEDVLRYAPGITVQKTTSNGFSYYSRGFAIDNIQIDGAAPMALTSTATSFYSQRMYNTVEFDHVEVLRGAGALFGGVGDPGGVINLVRKRALPDFKLKFEAAAGSWDNYRSQIDVTGPLTDDRSIRGRLVVDYVDRQYSVDNMATEKPTVYGVIEADITPSTTLTLGGMYERNHSNNYLGLPRYSNGDDIGLPRHTGLGQKWSYTDNTAQEVFAKVDHYFDNDWKLNVSYTNTHDAGSSLAAVTGNAVNPVTLAGPVWRGSVNRYWTNQNLVDSNLSGSFDAFGYEHQFVVGADYQRVTSQWKGSGVLSHSGTPVNVFDPGYWDPNPISYATPRVYSPNTQEQYGLYSRLTLQVADPFRVILGGRLARYHFEQTYKNAGVVQSEIDMREPTRFVPYAGAIYDLDDQWSLYTSYSKIFKPQQSYLKGPVTSSQTLEPLEGKTYEFGLKGELFDGRLNTGAALFYTKRENGAVQDPDYAAESVLWGGSCCYLNQGEVISKGIELEASGEVMKDWNVMASYVYNNNRNKTDSVAFSSITPKHQVKLWTTYQLPGPLDDWTLGGGVNLQSATYASGTASRIDGAGNVVETGIPFDYSQSGYAVYDAMLKYRVDDHWSLTLNANNLFDKVYYQTVASTVNGNFYGEPRNYMLTLRGEF